uniref:Uncharacterized protein n=1 Tax=Anguilla anguilla TaxID=7936 RepID=A0A0E9U962_ANGAN
MAILSPNKISPTIPFTGMGSNLYMPVLLSVLQ